MIVRSPFSSGPCRGIWIRSTAAVVLLSSTAGCGSDSLITPIPDKGNVYWALTLNHRAALLSMSEPFNTLAVTAAPRNVRGELLTGLPSAQYTSREPGRVGVTNEGVIVATAPTDPGQSVWVIASLTADNIKHVDSMLVRVVDDANPPVLAYFSAHPVAPDSNKLAASWSLGTRLFDTLPLQALDANGVPIANVPVAFAASDTFTAGIDAFGVFHGNRPGNVTFYASTTVFGVAKADTVPYRIGWPILRTISPSNPDNGPHTYSPLENTVGVGAVIAWGWFGEGDMDITFDDADLPNIISPLGVTDGRLAPVVSAFCSVGDCGSGNGVIERTASKIFVMRVFSQPGTYEFHSTMFGAGGRVIVVDDR